ncbi:hypothetical protein BaRGS_00029755, partial [Batillaria attramentaria]
MPSELFGSTSSGAASAGKEGDCQDDEFDSQPRAESKFSSTVSDRTLTVAEK